MVQGVVHLACLALNYMIRGPIVAYSCFQFDFVNPLHHMPLFLLPWIPFVCHSLSWFGLGEAHLS